MAIIHCMLQHVDFIYRIHVYQYGGFCALRNLGERLAIVLALLVLVFLALILLSLKIITFWGYNLKTP